MKNGIEAFSGYADFYDALYADKDYAREAAFVLELVSRYGETPPATLLDAGCGTGRHLIEFARSGIRTKGFDLSERMIGLAKARIAEAGREEPALARNLPDVTVADVRSFRDGKEYDCAVSMFAAMGYLTSNDDLLAALSTIRSHLKKGGLFLFDVWFGPAVLTRQPETRAKEFEAKGIRTIRLAIPEPDYLHNLVAVHYHILHFTDSQKVTEVRETHRMRFFFIPELELFLQQSGFALLKVCPFMESDREPTERDWNIAVVARAV